MLSQAEERSGSGSSHGTRDTTCELRAAVWIQRDSIIFDALLMVVWVSLALKLGI